MDDFKVLEDIKMPVRISFEPTIACNLNCPMCDRTKKDDYLVHKNEKLSYEAVKRFLYEVGREGIRYFLFIGGGEPLCDDHIYEYIQILKSYGVYVHLWTNGTLINDNNAQTLSEYCDMITVSLDSPVPATNDKSRGVEGAAEKSITGIKLLRKYSDKVFLRIHSVISSLNIDHLKEIADFAYENKVNEIGGALIAPYDFIPGYMRFTDAQLRILSNRIEDLCEYAKTKGVALAGCYSNVSAKIIQNLEHIHNMYTNRNKGTSKHITCMGLWGQAQIRPNGDVSVCCFTYKPILGNLHDMTFKEIWNGEKAEKFRETVKKGEYLDPSCIGCDTGHPVFTKNIELFGEIDSFLEMSINAR